MGDTSYNFIPDRGINRTSPPKSEMNATQGKRSFSGYENIQDNKPTSQESSSSNKKIVSYYLEEELIERIKKLADEQGMFYSSLVSRALKYWIQLNDR